ncbi:MAG: hypothetical protein GTO02_01380 [Candidatus Dadabacteria bacterium]|nr:hypothetical protein [Candidatus Dadabacteria bacterium]
MLRFLSKKPFSHLRIPGILERLNIINKVWLSPEMANGRDMIRLTRRFMKKDFKYVNLFFHSPSLKRGLTPFVKTRSDEKEFLNKIKEYLRFSKEEGIEPMTLFECQDLY